MKTHTFLIALMLTCCVTSSHGHEIYLKNGSIIESETVWKENGQIKFKRYGSTISLPRNMVKEIIYKEVVDQNKNPPHKQIEADLVPHFEPTVVDLTARLKSTLKHDTPLECACMCTLALKTAYGFGSGFFISEDGFIITNKHVVRGDRRQAKELQKEFEQRIGDLKRIKRNLDLKKKVIANYKTQLEIAQNELKFLQETFPVEDVGPYVEERKEKLLEFEKFIWEEEKFYKTDLKDYWQEKKVTDKLFKEFRIGQKQLASQHTFEVVLADESKMHAQLYALSKKYDLALLKVSGYQTPYLKLATEDSLSQGQRVYAVGSPANIELINTITSGVLSGFREDFIQTNAQINPGNSGGPLINDKGKVIGVNTKKSMDYSFEGIGFAIPVGIVLDEFRHYLDIMVAERK